MSSPDPLFDPDNCYEDDFMAFHDNEEDDNDDFYSNDSDPDGDGDYDPDYDDGMDGDHESGLASAGWGTDEDYGSYADDIESFHDYYGEDY